MIDPAVAATKYRTVRTIAGSDHFSEAVRGIAVGGQDHLYAVGDSAVAEFTADGELLRKWETERPGFSIAIDDDDVVWVGEHQQVEVFPAAGEPARWRDPERLGLITAIAVTQSEVLLADASARCIRRYTRAGHFLNDIGDQHRKGGFHIPNGVVDFALDNQGILHVANPGMHRVERYSAGGQLLGHFGRFDGRDPSGFPGCCNPTNVAIDGQRLIVTEKAGPRAKVYDAAGELLAVVADDCFDPLAKNMDVAVDSAGHIYVVDTATLAIRVFASDAVPNSGTEEATG